MKKYFLFAQTLFYILAGINHLVNPEVYLRFMPSFLPEDGALIMLSGWAEIILGILLVPVRTRRIAVWLIIAMLIVYLALIHIPMMIDYAQRHDPLIWVMIARLPLQFVLIFWAYRTR